MKKKIVYIAPHLSTGGLPQYLVKQVESIKDDMDVYCIEWENLTGGVLVVQRNKMINLLGDKLITLTKDKNELFKILDTLQPDIVHLQEIPELFMPNYISDQLYSHQRSYVLIETSHDSSFNVDNKLYLPDKFLMVSNYQKVKYDTLGVPCDVVEYPIENKVRTKTREQALRDLGLDPNLKHVINVGLFTPRKNQAEIIEYARMLKYYPIQFHFIGNQADNFKYYWEPLMKDLPSNCKWWNERSDVDSFYEAADLFLFTSRGNPSDMETMPLVIREALSWKVPSMIYNLPVYMGYFDKYDTIEYLTEDFQTNAYRLAEKLMVESPRQSFSCELNMDEQKVTYSTNIKISSPVTISVKDIDSDAVIWAVTYDEMPAGISYWMVPTPKHVVNFQTNETLGGITVEFYIKDIKVQTKEFRFRTPSVNKPKMKMINAVHPNYHNYVEFFVDKIYDKYLQGKTFDTVIDVGANIGVWAEYIKHTAQVNKLYLVEPNHEALKILNQNTEPDTVIIDKALSDSEGEMEFYINKENSLISSLARYDDLKSSYTVPVITFKKMLDDYGITHINLLKVDIETGEYPLFASLTTDDFKKIDNILMEYHLLAGRTVESDLNPLIEQLQTNGYFVEKHMLHSVGGFIFATKSAVKADTTIVLYSDKNYEPQAKLCIQSLKNKLDSNCKIVYFTVGFKSDFEFPNLHTIEYPFKPEYPHLLFYKPDICLEAMKRFPSNTYIYTDSDVLFSKRFSHGKLKHNLPYPKASFGPHEYVNFWESEGQHHIVFFDETKLMEYFNVQKRSQRYVWACLFTYNENCKDFLEEYKSMCSNQYLLKDMKSYFPLKDETAFNVCLWKRNATENLGFAFVNTHLLETVREVEECSIVNKRTDRVIDNLGEYWEYVKNSDDVIFYHGFKDEQKTLPILNYLTNR